MYNEKKDSPLLAQTNEPESAKPKEKPATKPKAAKKAVVKKKAPEEKSIVVKSSEMEVIDPGPSKTIATVFDGVGLLPVEQQNILLEEYDARRDNFLRWLISHLKEGVHFGFPPGCTPKAGTNILQWKAKPSLYKAGALLLVDLRKLTPVYSADNATWKQFGSKAGLICMKCVLFAGDAVLGEGRGTYSVGEKSGMKENATIKMAEKRALVDAVINSIPVVGDLFTQDEPARQKASMTLEERKGALVEYVEQQLNERKSQWDGSAADFIIRVITNLTGQKKIGSIGGVNLVERVLKDGNYDWNTAERIPDEIGVETNGE